MMPEAWGLCVGVKKHEQVPFPVWEALGVRARSPRTCLCVPEAEAGGQVSTSQDLVPVSPSLGIKLDHRRLEPRRSSASLGAGEGAGWGCLAESPLPAPTLPTAPESALGAQDPDHLVAQRVME